MAAIERSSSHVAIPPLCARRTVASSCHALCSQSLRVLSTHGNCSLSAAFHRPMRASRHHLLLLGLLLSVVLLCCVAPLSLALAARQADGAFRAWHLADVAPYPNNDIVYVTDSPNYIRALSATTGAALQSNASVPAGQTIAGIAVDGSNSRVWAITEGIRGWRTREYWLWTFTSELQAVANLSLATLSPPPSLGDRYFSALSVDQDGNVCIVRQLANSTVLVDFVSAAGLLVRQWTAPLPVERGIRYYPAAAPHGLLYFRADGVDGYYYDPPLYVVTLDGVLTDTLTLEIDTDTCDSIFSMAVSHSGRIALACDSGLQLFDSGGALVSSFSYASPLVSWMSFTALSFDGADRLLAVAPSVDYGVQVISSTTGELLRVWYSAVPELSLLNNIAYDPWSHSLVAFRELYNAAVVRLDADTGSLLQQYSLGGRHGNCWLLASDIGPSRDIYLLLGCSQPYPSGVASVVLHAVSATGRVRREVRLVGWSPRMLLEGALLVREEQQMFYLVASTGRVNEVAAFAFDGTNLFNATDPSTGNLGWWNTRLVRVDDRAMAVVDPLNNRIVLLALDNGAFLRNITAPSYTQLLAAAYDGESWYRSEVTYDRSAREWVNSSIRHYAADGKTVLALYAMNNRDFHLLAIASGEHVHRLYAPDEESGAVVWWSRQSQQQPREAREISNAVVIAASGTLESRVREQSARHSAGMHEQLPGEQQDECFRAAVLARRQQWQDGRKKREGRT